MNKCNIFGISNTIFAAETTGKKGCVIKFRAFGKYSIPLLSGLLFSGLVHAQEENTMPPARDPAIAVQEEYDMALRSNTAVAWQRFIARHQGHPLAADASAHLKKLQNDTP